jgi:Mono-functional DNA-alkylating methyl methanesulfonate N-term
MPALRLWPGSRDLKLPDVPQSVAIPYVEPLRTPRHPPSCPTSSRPTSRPQSDTLSSVPSFPPPRRTSSSRPPPVPYKKLTPSCSNILQIYTFDAGTGECVPVAEHSLHGKVLALAVHRPPFYDGRDHLFVLTDNYVAFTCSWDSSTSSLRNEKVVEGLLEPSLRQTDSGALVRIDPGERCVGLYLYQGLITFLLIHRRQGKRKYNVPDAVEPGTILEAVSLRCKVLNLINFVFLRTEGEQPVLAVLWRDQELRKMLSVWEVDKLYKPADRDFVERYWANGQMSVEVDRGANLLIPTKNGTVSRGRG